MAGFVNFLLRLVFMYIIWEGIGFILGYLALRLNSNPKPQKVSLATASVLFTITKFVGLALLTTTTFMVSTWLRLPWKLVSLTIILLGAITWLALVVKNPKDQNTVKKLILRNRAYIVFSFLLFAFFTVIRVNFPQYNTTEKPMDYAFISSFLKQRTPPFENPWFSGILLNYYYIGQFALSILLNLTNTPPEYGYNILVGLVGIWVFQAIYALLMFLKEKLGIRLNHASLLIGALTVTLGGNLYAFKKILLKEYFYYPEPTRVITNAINEFPSYSIVLGDLHAHFIDLAFFITALLLGLVILTDSYSNIVSRYKAWFSLGVLVGFCLTTNSWDLLPLTFAFGLGLLITIIRKPQYILDKLWLKALLFLTPALGQILTFKKYFITPATGFAVKINNDLYYWLILWGQFIVPILVGLVFLIYDKIRQGPLRKRLVELIPLCIILTTGIFNILLASVVYPKSVFVNTPYYRANTVFKMYYMAWPLLGVSAFVLVWYGFGLIQKRRKLFRSLYALLYSLWVGMLLSYWVLAFGQVFGKGITHTPTMFIEKLSQLPYSLDGTTFIKAHSQTDYYAKQILREKTINTSTVVLQLATWKSYDPYKGSLCTYTGNICVLNWPLHTNQWHRTLQAPAIDKRTHKKVTIDITLRLKEVQDFYLSPNYDLINKYNIKYVILSSAEREFLLEHGINIKEWHKKLLRWCNLYQVKTAQSTTAIYKCL